LLYPHPLSELRERRKKERRAQIREGRRLSAQIPSKGTYFTLTGNPFVDGGRIKSRNNETTF